MNKLKCKCKNEKTKYSGTLIFYGVHSRRFNFKVNYCGTCGMVHDVSYDLKKERTRI